MRGNVRSPVKADGVAIELVDRALAEIDIATQGLRGETGLIEITLVDVDAEDIICAAALHFDGIETAVTPDIEN